VKKHDLYVLDLVSGATRRATQDGSATVYNGRSTGSMKRIGRPLHARAFEWSPDGKHLAYLRA